MNLVQLKILCKILIKPVLLVASSPCSRQFNTKFKTVENLNLVFCRSSYFFQSWNICVSQQQQFSGVEKWYLLLCRQTGSKFKIIKRIHIQKFTHARKCKPSKIQSQIYKCFSFSFLDTVSAQTISFIPMELSRVTSKSQIYTLLLFPKKTMFKENEQFGGESVAF